MNPTHKEFLLESERKAFDLEHRKKLKFNIGKYDVAVIKGKLQYDKLEVAKNRAARIKRNVVNNMEALLTEFESNFLSNGGKIIWAETAEQAVKAVLDIARKYDAKKVVKSKSMITEEIELNHHLIANGIETLETDLGEYIVQLDDDKPYHIVTPAMHKSKEDIAKLFHEKFKTAEDATPEELTYFVRKLLREKFLQADLGITGANFLLADVGGIALTENEGNGVLSMSAPKVHIAIAGFEKLLPSIHDLDLFWSLLSTHGTGQKVTVYNSVVTGPRKPDELDGPDEMYLVLVDNGRNKVLEADPQKEALSCIRCGACLNVCPIYKNVGGHTYESVYSGPIGSVLTPFMKGFEEYNHLSYACTLCGKCTWECPVKIPLHELLLYNRRDAVEKGFSPKSFSRMMKAYKKVMHKRWMIEAVPTGIKNVGMKLTFSGAWGPRRQVPKFQDSFHSLWKKESHGKQ
jgi:L-lactate dehydrogenase complex protein LldF